MKKTILTVLMLGIIGLAAAQKGGRQLAYAITSEAAGSYDYSEIRIVDVHTGAVVKPLFTKTQAYKATSARSGKAIVSSDHFAVADSLRFPTASMVGAAAYDKKHNRLFFTPLGVNQLRYYDLSHDDANFSYVDDVPFGVAKNKQDVAEQICRMVIDADGNGYGMSNDGNHLIRFTTGNPITITDLGPVIDDTRDSVNAYHKMCSCAAWGGDMVADTRGDLYVISAFNNVYKVTTSNRLISYLGPITGLPAGFTSNGAAVDDDGELIIACAASAAAVKHPYYKLDIGTLKATKLDADAGILNTADLATSNLLYAPSNTTVVQLLTSKLNTGDMIENSHISTYPNPVQGDYFNMVFTGLEKGDYEIQLYDLQGRAISKKSIRIVSDRQTEQVDVRATGGIKSTYMVSVVGARAQKAVFNNKIILE